MKENRPILRERDVINDRYKIVNLVGSGGYGTVSFSSIFFNLSSTHFQVYRAIDLDTRVYVALKAEKDSKNEVSVVIGTLNSLIFIRFSNLRTNRSSTNTCNRRQTLSKVHLFRCCQLEKIQNAMLVTLRYSSVVPI